MNVTRQFLRTVGSSIQRDHVVRELRHRKPITPVEHRLRQLDRLLHFGDGEKLGKWCHRLVVPGAFETPCGTCPVATWRRADSTLACESSKKISAPNACRNGPLSRPPRNKASSRRTPQLRSVRITRLCAGAERAVTSAVRIGESSPAGNAACKRCSAARNPRNGPPDSGLSASSASLR